MKDYQSTQLEWPIRSGDFEVLAVNPLDDDYRLYAVAGVFQDNEIWPEYHAEADGCGRERTVVPIPAMFMPESESAEPGVYVVECP